MNPLQHQLQYDANSQRARFHDGPEMDITPQVLLYTGLTTLLFFFIWAFCVLTCERLRETAPAYRKLIEDQRTALREKAERDRRRRLRREAEERATTTRAVSPLLQLPAGPEGVKED